ncbi:hypothetical protein FRC09_008482 [Ceratobasidium sp. 395]|nr:hypothetical protein FRC09_008482 [Ceratobasidium sp. 395]
MPILNRTWKSRRLLALDGGGPCGMSTIILMEELMRLMQRELGLSTLPRPGEVFDLMAGSGTGGLLAIMWGRLMMTIDESKKYFSAIGSEVFSEKKWTATSNTMFKASKLENATRKMLMKHLGNEDARMNDPQSSNETCKAFVIFLLPGPDCSVVEAIRATCASIGLFKPVEITEPGDIAISYMDGSINNNNPTPRLLEEAGLVFPGQDVACIINLGAGRPRMISVPDPGSPKSSWPSELSTMLMTLAMDCERTAQEMETRFAHIPEAYFRFSVDQGLEDVTLWDWGENVVPHTHAYLRLLDTSAKMNRAVQVLAKDEMKVPVGRIGM